MRIFNVSYNDPKVERAVNGICGGAIGFWTSIRMGGTGSQRFELIDGPAELLEMVDRLEDRRFSSLELRKGGLVFRFRNRLEALAIPLAWSTIAEVKLSPVGPAISVDFRVRTNQGTHLHFRMAREQHVALDRLLRKGLPASVPFA
ncbi:MAG: hypothetical protein JNL52_13490 [Flavobacteriales bacterium]|nr:hypothetical protein [Flavobacteriales bacterium]